jgi:alpha-tubulin suppressor-like RCC1 family protein
VLVAGGVTLAAASAGTDHTCGVTAAGTAYCWGANSFGDLGDGTVIARSSPVLVAGGVSFAAVRVVQ